MICNLCKSYYVIANGENIWVYNVRIKPLGGNPSAAAILSSSSATQIQVLIHIITLLNVGLLEMTATTQSPHKFFSQFIPFQNVTSEGGMCEIIVTLTGCNGDYIYVRESNKKHNLKASLDVKLQVQKLITSPVKVGVEGNTAISIVKRKLDMD